jgi:amino acid permease
MGPVYIEESSQLEHDLLPNGHVLGTGSTGVGIGKSVFNFTTLVIGGGLLGWPNAFKLCGWFGGFVCLLIVCACAESTMCLMVNIAVTVRTMSYEETCCAVWGSTGFFAVALTCYMIDFGVLVSYWVALGTLATPLVSSLLQRSVSVTEVKLGLAAVMLPVCFFRNIGKLPGWSYVSYAFVLFASFTMVYLSYSADVQAYNDHPVADTDWFKQGFWPSTGTLAFTYVNHDSVFTIFQNLNSPTPSNWALVCRWSMWSTVALTCIVGMPIYFALGERTSSDITDNFPTNLRMMMFVRGCLVCVLLMTWVYLQQVGRKYLHSLLMPLFRCRFPQASDSYRMTPLEIGGFTLVQFVVTFALGLAVTDLGLPMALTGVFAQALAAFVIPPCLLFTLSYQGQNAGYTRLQMVGFAGVLLFGVACCTIGAVEIIRAQGR